MNDIMKAIEILQSVRDMLTARHRFLEPFGDLPEEIEQLQEVIAMLSHLHDERERLRNLQPEDVTGAQIHTVERIVGPGNSWDFVPESNLIAAAVRVVLGGDT